MCPLQAARSPLTPHRPAASKPAQHNTAPDGRARVHHPVGVLHANEAARTDRGSAGGVRPTAVAGSAASRNDTSDTTGATAGVCSCLACTCADTCSTDAGACTHCCHDHVACASRPEHHARRTRLNIGSLHREVLPFRSMRQCLAAAHQVRLSMPAVNCRTEIMAGQPSPACGGGGVRGSEPCCKRHRRVHR